VRSLLGRLCGESPALGLRVNRGAANSNAAMMSAYGILTLGALGYLLPSQVALQILPYYGSTIFGSACVLAIPFLIVGGGLHARTNLILIVLVAYGSLVALAMEYIQHRSNSLPSTRVMLEDVMQLGSFAAGGCAAVAGPHRLIRSMRAWGVLALAVVIGQIALMRIGVLSSAWSEDPSRQGGPSVYFALSMALCASPAVFMSSRGTLLGVLVVAAEMFTGVVSQTRTLLFNGAALLLLQAYFDGSKRKPRLPRSLWGVLVAMVAASGVLAIAYVAQQRNTGVVDPTGRDVEIASLIQEMSGAERGLGVGLGRGFRRYGAAEDGGERESITTSVHFATGALLVKFGIPIGATLTVSMVVFAVTRLWRKSSTFYVLPAYLIGCALIDSAFAGLYKPVVLFTIGAALAWPSERHTIGRLNHSGNRRVNPS
jgi:hypothetical protein